jgi:hypothetical protein
LAHLAIAEEEQGYIPRSMRRGPDVVPEGQKWCWFCEELHDLNYFTGPECREYVVYKGNMWRRDPNNIERQREYWRRYSMKVRLKKMIEETGCRVSSIEYHPPGTLEITIHPKYWKKRPVKR